MPKKNNSGCRCCRCTIWPRSVDGSYTLDQWDVESGDWTASSDGFSATLSANWLDVDTNGPAIIWQTHRQSQPGQIWIDYLFPEPPVFSNFQTIHTVRVDCLDEEDRNNYHIWKIVSSAFFSGDGDPFGEWLYSNCVYLGKVTDGGAETYYPGNCCALWEMFEPEITLCFDSARGRATATIADAGSAQHTWTTEDDELAPFNGTLWGFEARSISISVPITNVDVPINPLFQANFRVVTAFKTSEKCKTCGDMNF